MPSRKTTIASAITAIVPEKDANARSFAPRLIHGWSRLPPISVAIRGTFLKAKSLFDHDFSRRINASWL
jgi:hypothetical protein